MASFGLRVLVLLAGVATLLYVLGPTVNRPPPVRPVPPALGTPLAVDTLPLVTGTTIPQLGFGTWRLADSRRAVTWALQSGYRHIDTAVAYRNEAVIGDVMAELGVRSVVFLTTKLLPQDFGRVSTERSFRESLNRLRTDYVDLYLLHAPDRNWQESWKVVEEFYDAKKARAIGVSNFREDQLRELLSIARVRPAVVQNYFSPWHQDKAVLQLCRQNNIVYEGYSTLGSDRNAKNVLNNEQLKSISERYGCTPAQLLIRWSLQRGIVAIPRSDSKDHIVENGRATTFTISDVDMGLIDNFDP